MGEELNTTVRMYGLLHSFRKERGLASTTQVTIGPEGQRAEDLAVDLGLPLDKIEGVFVNHLVFDLDKRIQAGDKVAFIPIGIPGPHRFLLGIFKSGKDTAQQHPGEGY